jgi:geranylgeranyl diphosphate synthase, type II
MMPQVSFEEQLKSYQDLVNKSLPDAFTGTGEAPDLTIEAALYSLTAGGKRIRPVLMLAAADMLHVERERVMPFALAIEMIHTYSLIHDDLPCMDNDDTRRGMPTCHVRYTEPIALLAGDALLNRAYEVVLEASSDGDRRKVKAASFLASMAGARGMIGGQTLDVLSEGKCIPEDVLKTLHCKKTGCLLTAPVMIPVFLAEDSHDKDFLAAEMTEFAAHIGLAFQIKDDILDVTSTREMLGKSTGKDAAENKSTFVTIYGLEKAGELLEEESGLAFDALARIRAAGYDTAFLEEMNRYLLKREK